MGSRVGDRYAGRDGPAEATARRDGLLGVRRACRISPPRSRRSRRHVSSGSGLPTGIHARARRNFAQAGLTQRRSGSVVRRIRGVSARVRFYPRQGGFQGGFQGRSRFHSVSPYRPRRPPNVDREPSIPDVGTPEARQPAEYPELYPLESRKNHNHWPQGPQGSQGLGLRRAPRAIRRSPLNRGDTSPA